jgi:hypothetical protein
MNTPRTHPITLEQIDKTLEEWQTRLRFAMDNLLALDDSLTYKRLEGKDGLPQTRLTGITHTQVTPALAAMRDLFQHINRLSDVVERAANMRKALPRFFPSDNALRDIDALLNGPSVRLPSVQTPLAQRSLMSAAETPQTITPSRLLEVMTQAFDQARSAITAVDAAWAHLEPTLGDCETQAVDLQRMAGELGESDAPDLAALRQKLAALRVRVESDPLGVEADFDGDVRPLLARTRARLLEASRQRSQMQSELSRARTLFAQLNTLHQQCEEALTECRQQIADPNGLKAPLKPEWLVELSAWLDTLETALRQGRWKAARVGLDRWLQTAGQYIEAERAACTANRAPIELRAELKGRLSALKAKAQARGMAQDTELSALAYQAETLLRERPTPTVHAAQIVSEYEARVAHKK